MKRLLIILLFIVSSCTTNKKLTFGCYEAKNDNLIFYYNIQLRSDSSYYFSNTGDMYKGIQQGHWKIRNNKLILNSNIQPTTKGYYKETVDNSQKQFGFILFDIYGKPIDGQHHVYIKQDSNYLSPKQQTDNIYLIDKNKLKNNYRIGIGTEFKEVEINIKNPHTNCVLVYLVPDTKGFFQINKQYKIKDSSSFASKTVVFNKINCDN